MRRRQLTFLAVTVVAALGLLAPAGAAAHNKRGIEHIVVVYQENHSFDNLYGGWEGVNGLGKADRAHTVQVDQDGEPYDCLRQDDVNLTSPPLAADCDPTSHFRNRPFSIDDFIAPMDTTCPPPGVFALNGVAKGEGLEGGCTRDLVHRFYQEQYQLHGGKQDRYVTGSDALGLTMGTYDTRELPIYRYLHRPAHPRYAIADNFFQAAFGGSFLNHQWLAAAATPVWPDAVNDGGSDDLHSVVDANGMPIGYPLYTPTAGANVKDQALTASCDPGPGRDPTPARHGLRRLRGQHDPAAVPAVCARDGGDPPPAGPDGADDRRPAQRQGDRLGLVLGRVVERQRGRRRAGLDQRRRPELLGPERRGQRGLPELPGQAVPVPPPAAQLLRLVRARDGRAGGPPARRAGVRRRSQGLAARLRAQAGQLHQAGRGGERAPRVRERRHGLRPSGRPAARRREQPLREAHLVVVTYDEFGGAWDHVPPPGPGRHARPARRVGPRNPHPGAGDLARSCTSASASTAGSTTRPRSWRRSNAASACAR